MEENTRRYYYMPGGSSHAVVRNITTKGFRSQLIGITERKDEKGSMLLRLQKQLRACNPVDIARIEQLVDEAKKDVGPLRGAEGAYAGALVNYATNPASEWFTESMEDLAKHMHKDSQYQLARYTFETAVKKTIRALLALRNVNPHRHRKYRILLVRIDFCVPNDLGVRAPKIDLLRRRHPDFDPNQIIFPIVADDEPLDVEAAVPHWRMLDLGEGLSHSEVLCVASATTREHQDEELYGQTALWGGPRYSGITVNPSPAVGTNDWLENMLGTLQDHWVWQHWEDLDSEAWTRYAALLGRYAKGYYYMETIYLFRKIDDQVKRRAIKKYNRAKAGNPANMGNIHNFVTLQDQLNDPGNSMLDFDFSRTLTYVHRTILHVCYRWRIEAGCRDCGSILDFTCRAPEQIERELGSHCCGTSSVQHWEERVLSIQTPYMGPIDGIINTWRKYICTQCGYMSTGHRHDIMHHMMSHHELPLEYQLCGYSREGISNLAGRFKYDRESIHVNESIWVGNAATLERQVTFLGKCTMEKIRLGGDVPLDFIGYLGQYGHNYSHVLKAPKRQLLCRMQGLCNNECIALILDFNEVGSRNSVRDVMGFIDQMHQQASHGRHGNPFVRFSCLLWDQTSKVANLVFRAYRSIETYVLCPRFAPQYNGVLYAYMGLLRCRAAIENYDVAGADVDIHHFYISSKDPEMLAVHILLPGAVQLKFDHCIKPVDARNYFSPPQHYTTGPRGIDMRRTLEHHKPKVVSYTVTSVLNQLMCYIFKLEPSDLQLMWLSHHTLASWWDMMFIGMGMYHK